MAELIPDLGDPVEVQRRLEFSIVEGLEWHRPLLPRPRHAAANSERRAGGDVVEFKVKNSLITQDRADSDPQAWLYHERYGPDQPSGFADPTSWKCGARYCYAWASCPGGRGL